MRTFAQKQNQPQKPVSSSLARSHTATPALHHRADLILHLQRTIGNQAVQRLLQANAEEFEVGLTDTASPRFGHDFSRIPIHPPAAAAAAAIQMKLAINKPGDEYEQEADRVSEQVMRTPEPQLQRACPCGDGCPKCQTGQLAQEHDRLQTKHVGSGDLVQIAVPPIVDEVLSSPGQPLDTATRSLMGPRFGHDFSRVRVHTDQLAAQSAESVAAQAYTVGSDVVFGAGRYAPASREGQRLLAHELTHVVQQGGTGGPPGLAQEAAAEEASKAVETGVRPQVRARSLVGLAAQPDPARAGVGATRLEPMEIKLDPFGVDSRLGLRIVDPSEIEARVRRILLAPGGRAVAQCKADFSSSPRIARANLEHSHWRNDNERLLYARCYFEQFLGSGGEGVDSETLVRALVSYEVQVQRQSADLVVHNPLTPDDKAKLGELRKQRTAEGEKRASFEGPLAEARADFVSNQDSSFWHTKELLAPHEINKAADAVVMVTKDVATTVPLQFFEYYSDHMLMKMDADEERKARKKDTYALTDPGGNTRLRSDVISFPEGKLGPLLLHELGHTQDVQSAMGLGDFQEGHGYAVEYFFSKDKERKAKILDLLSSDVLVIHSQKPALRKLFHETLATLIALTEVIQRGSSPHLPANIVPDAETARRLIAERVVKSKPSSDQLKAITRHVEGHLEAFNLPGI